MNSSFRARVADRSVDNPYRPSQCFVAAVSPDDQNHETLYIFSAHYVRSSSIKQLVDGRHVITYQTDFGTQLISPDSFTNINEAWDYYTFICEAMLNPFAQLSVVHWLRKYPEYRNKEVMAFSTPYCERNLA